MEAFENILDRDGEAYFFPHFFSAGESDDYFHLLRKEIAWKQEPIFLFGRSVLQPRLTAWYGDPDMSYRYSGVTMQPQTWTATLLDIKQRIEKIAPVLFNSALLNQYRDEKDSVGWHRDNEKSLGEQPVIGSVSFGAPRHFQFRRYDDQSVKRSLELTSGSLLLMQGRTQHAWEHRIPKQSRVTGIRINITFRVIKEPITGGIGII
jgi:alkylated DNA repair dioxygenase AlkB